MPIIPSGRFKWRKGAGRPSPTKAAPPSAAQKSRPATGRPGPVLTPAFPARGSSTELCTPLTLTRQSPPPGRREPRQRQGQTPGCLRRRAKTGSPGPPHHGEGTDLSRSGRCPPPPRACGSAHPVPGPRRPPRPGPRGDRQPGFSSPGLVGAGRRQRVGERGAPRVSGSRPRTRHAGAREDEAVSSQGAGPGASADEEGRTPARGGGVWRAPRKVRASPRRLLSAFVPGRLARKCPGGHRSVGPRAGELRLRAGRQAGTTAPCSAVLSLSFSAQHRAQHQGPVSRLSVRAQCPAQRLAPASGRSIRTECLGPASGPSSRPFIPGTMKTVRNVIGFERQGGEPSSPKPPRCPVRSQSSHPGRPLAGCFRAGAGGLGQAAPVLIQVRPVRGSVWEGPGP